jgi:hypothetical protein
MHSAESAPLKDLLAELDVVSENPPSNGGHRQKRAGPYRSSGDFHFRNDEPFRSDKPPMSKRVARTVALFLFAVLIGAGGTLASQSYRDEIIEVFPPFGWLSPVSTLAAPVPAVTTSDLQEGLKPLAVDLALVRRSVEQLGSNLDQLARKQDQLSQNMATLQAAEQEVSQKVSAPAPAAKAVSAPTPRPKAVHVPLPPPKSLEPPAQ